MGRASILKFGPVLSSPRWRMQIKPLLKLGLWGSDHTRITSLPIDFTNICFHICSIVFVVLYIYLKVLVVFIYLTYSPDYCPVILYSYLNANSINPTSHNVNSQLYIHILSLLSVYRYVLEIL